MFSTAKAYSDVHAFHCNSMLSYIGYMRLDEKSAYTIMLSSILGIPVTLSWRSEKAQGDNMRAL